MKEAPSSALRSLRGCEEPASFRVVPACGEKAVGQAQEDGRPAIAPPVRQKRSKQLIFVKCIRLFLECLLFAISLAAQQYLDLYNILGWV